jgi:hypothetical protein
MWPIGLKVFLPTATSFKLFMSTYSTLIYFLHYMVVFIRKLQSVCKCSDLFTNRPPLLLAWLTLFIILLILLSAFIPAYLFVWFGVWLYQSLWFIISHQCGGPYRILASSSPVRFFPLDPSLVPLPSHGTCNVLPCKTVSFTCFQSLHYFWHNCFIIRYYAVNTIWLDLSLFFIHGHTTLKLPTSLHGTAKTITNCRI